MKDITIIFSHSKRYNKILFWFRSKFLGHSATHVGFGLLYRGEPIVFHMSAKGAVRTERQRFLRHNDIVKEYAIVPDLRYDLEKHFKYLGTPYDYGSAVWHLIALIVRPLKQFFIYYKIKNAFYCANFARQIDETGKIKSWSSIDPNWASVDELMEACRVSNEFKEIIDEK